jgi:hypothetical protein
MKGWVPGLGNTHKTAALPALIVCMRRKSYGEVNGV